LLLLLRRLEARPLRGRRAVARALARGTPRADLVARRGLARARHGEAAGSRRREQARTSSRESLTDRSSAQRAQPPLDLGDVEGAVGGEGEVALVVLDAGAALAAEA